MILCISTVLKIFTSLRDSEAGSVTEPEGPTQRLLQMGEIQLKKASIAASILEPYLKPHVGP